MYEDGDWYEDENGIIFEYGFDIDNNMHRWFKVSPIFYIPIGRKVEPPV